jgi:hypothetical protein
MTDLKVQFSRGSCMEQRRRKRLPTILVDLSVRVVRAGMELVEEDLGGR